MKKTVFALVMTILFYCNGMAQRKVSLIDIKGVEMAVILDKDDDHFKEFYVFQYEGATGFVNSYSSITLIASDKETIKLKADEDILTFTLIKGYSNPNEKIVYGYGLSHRNGDYRLIDSQNPSSVMDLLNLTNVALSGDLSCHSGGVGSSECSTTGSDLGQIPGGGGGCSVKCNNGYYACCDGAKNECRCNPEKKNVSTH